MRKFLLSIFAVMLTVFSVQAAEVSGTITFKTSGSDSSTAATNANFVSNQVTDNGGFTLSCTATNNCYTGKSGLKMSSGSKNGSFTLGLGGTYNVKTITVSAVKYGSDAGKVAVNGATAQSLSSSTATDYTFAVNSEINQIKVDMTKRGYIASITVVYEVAGEGGGETPDAPVLETLATPEISPASCEFNIDESLNVTISAVDGATIYYTLNGENPTTESDVYSTPITIEETTVVKAIAVKDGYNNSEVAAATFTAVDPNAKTTTFDFTKPAELTPSVTTFTNQAYNTTGTTFTSDGITLNTTDGSTASRIWEGSSYDLRVYKNATMTIAAPAGGIITSIEFTGTVNDFSADSGVLNSKIWAGNASKVVFTWSSGASTQKINTITVAYSIDESIVVIAQPSLTPATSFVGSTTVEITNNEEGTTLYYSTNGEDYEPYTGALTISETTTVYAYAQDAQENKSAVAEATYTKIEVLSIAEAKAAYDNAGANIDVAVDLTGAVVTVNNGQYLFIENETTGINIFNSGANYAVGTKFTAGYILGTSTVYGKMHQITGAEFNNVETTTVTVEPTEVEVADLAGNNAEWEGRFVKLSGVSVNVAAKTITQGDDTYALYNRFALELSDAAMCDIEGIVAIYNTTEQLYITKVTPFHTLSVTNAGWATLYLDFAAAIPAGVEAYTVTEVNDGYVTLTPVEGVLPANTGVIVKADEANYTFAYSTETPATVEGNLLVGTTVDEEIAEEAYVLGNVDGVGLYKADMADGVWLNNANKAYLPMSAVENKSAQFFGFDWAGTTAIEGVEVENEVKAIYDLTGRKVETISAPGIYIVNGVKRVVR